jgi:hypothetical protein
VSSAERSYFPLTIDDLRQLKELALKEHDDFFRRNPHLEKAYRNSLIAICLCQGAALHYINPTVGVKDFDIWHFYIENESTPFPYRAWKRIENGYRGKPIDFLKRAIPRHIYEKHIDEPDRAVLEYLLARNTITKRLLLKKAIIGLYPDKIFSKILWRGDLTHNM